MIQNIFAVKGFQSKGVSTFPFSIYLAISASVGATLGALMSVNIDGDVFNRILAVIMILVVSYIVFKPNMLAKNIQERTSGNYFWWSMVAFFFVGIYGGFIQAGVGFIILLLYPFHTLLLALIIFNYYQCMSKKSFMSQ